MSAVWVGHDVACAEFGKAESALVRSLCGFGDGVRFGLWLFGLGKSSPGDVGRYITKPGHYLLSRLRLFAQFY